MAALADAVGDGNQGSLLRTRCRHERRLPRQLQVEARVGAADQEHESKVARAHVERRDQERGTGGTGYDGSHNVPAGLLELARGPGKQTSSAVRNGIWRGLY